jgi:hypothetical protein
MVVIKVFIVFRGVCKLPRWLDHIRQRCPAWRLGLAQCRDQYKYTSKNRLQGSVVHAFPLLVFLWFKR